jgi:hypothetical protein
MLSKVDKMIVLNVLTNVMVLVCDFLVTARVAAANFSRAFLDLSRCIGLEFLRPREEQGDRQTKASAETLKMQT